MERGAVFFVFVFFFFFSASSFTCTYTRNGNISRIFIYLQVNFVYTPNGPLKRQTVVTQGFMNLKRRGEEEEAKKNGAYLLSYNDLNT